MTPRTFLLRFALTALGVLAATQIVPGIECSSLEGLLIAALVLGLLNAFLRPLLLVLSLPLLVFSLGLFLWIINASLLCFVGWLVKPFHVASFPSALGGAAVISLVSVLGGRLLGLNRAPAVTFRTSVGTRPSSSRPASKPDRSDGPGSGSGPIIDV